MLEAYAALVVLFIVAAAGVGVLAARHREGRTPEEGDAPPRSAPSAAVESPAGATAEPGSLVLLAIAAVALTTQALLLFPFAAVFPRLGWFGYWAMASFVLPIGIVLVYQHRKGGLPW